MVVLKSFMTCLCGLLVENFSVNQMCSSKPDASLKIILKRSSLILTSCGCVHCRSGRHLFKNANLLSMYFLICLLRCGVAQTCVSLACVATTHKGVKTFFSSLYMKKFYVSWLRSLWSTYKAGSPQLGACNCKSSVSCNWRRLEDAVPFNWLPQHANGNLSYLLRKSLNWRILWSWLLICDNDNSERTFSFLPFLLIHCWHCYVYFMMCPCQSFSLW